MCMKTNNFKSSRIRTYAKTLGRRVGTQHAAPMSARSPRLESKRRHLAAAVLRRQKAAAPDFGLGLDLDFGLGLAEPLTVRFSWTASRIRALRAGSLIFSFSWMSMARRTLPSRLELKSLAGSLSAAPLAKVSLTTAL